MKRATASLLYQSPNGDTWFLARDPRTGLAFVRHQANTPSGGQVTDLEIGAFLNRPRNPEQDALFRAIGVLLLGPKRAGAGDEQSGAGTRGEWSDAQLSELGYM